MTEATEDGYLVKAAFGEQAEPVELPSQKIALVTYAGGVRQVIGEAEVTGDEVVARIPLASLELGVVRTLRAEAAKGYSLRRPEIVFMQPQMVTGVLFPTELRFQSSRTE